MKSKQELMNFQNAKAVWKFLNDKQKKQIMSNILKYFNYEN